MQNQMPEKIAKEFMQKLDGGLSERRLLKEISELSCDELATVLVMWHRTRRNRVPPAQAQERLLPFGQSQ